MNDWPPTDPKYAKLFQSNVRAIEEIKEEESNKNSGDSNYIGTEKDYSSADVIDSSNLSNLNDGSFGTYAKLFNSSLINNNSSLLLGSEEQK